MYLHGNYFRYQDFFNFLSDNNIEFNINNKNLNEFDINVIDIVYYCDIEKLPLNENCFIFCGSSYKILELESKNIKLDYSRFLTHNLYYAQCFNGIFLPMFLHTNDITLTGGLKRYKYGVFATHYDMSYLLFDEIINTLGISYQDILFMDNENFINRDMNTTNDKNIFYSSIETFLDFTNDYTNRHVMSRTYLELIANNIPIQIVSFNNSKPISFRGFSHIEYETVAEYHLFDLLNVKYETKYFRTDTYSDYIKYALNNLNKPIKLATVEEYSN